MYEHTKRARKSYIHPHQHGRYLCVDSVTNSLHIMEHLAMHQ